MSETPSSSRSNQVRKLIEAARGGSQDALGQLAESCRNYLLAIANAEIEGTLRAKVGGSDLVQQTLMEGCRDFAKFNGEREEELLGWLRSILLNNLANLQRYFQDTAKRELDREIPLDQALTNDRARGGGLASNQTPLHDAIRLEHRKLLAEAVQRMPASLRDVMLLRREQELSFAEIGVRLNRSEDAVRKLYARAVLWLQDHLGSPHD